jgi:hypothetical protein
MTELKSAGIRKIEERIKDADPDSLRALVLNKAKDFKTSWIALGQALYTIWKDKIYREWGYQQFETYAAKEIGVRKDTAMKLLKSYCFLEKEEPQYLQKDYIQDQETSSVPNYEAVNVLRMVKDKKVLDPGDYENLRKDVFQRGKDAKEIKKGLTQLIKQRQELDPEEAREKQNEIIIKRFLATLKSIKHDVEILKLLPASIIEDTEKLIQKIEAEIN